MAEFPASTPSPARVHDRARQLMRMPVAWVCRPYDGRIYSVEHFRICSWCCCIHPVDLMELLEAGGSTLEPSTKQGKFLFRTPNPVAGDLVRMGSVPGPVFPRRADAQPADLISSLLLETDPALPFRPSMSERLAGHFERPALETAPAMITWPFYAEHTTDRQWPEIWAAARQGGAQHAAP